MELRCCSFHLFFLLCSILKISLQSRIYPILEILASISPNVTAIMELEVLLVSFVLDDLESVLASCFVLTC